MYHMSEQVSGGGGVFSSLRRLPARGSCLSLSEPYRRHAALGCRRRHKRRQKTPRRRF